MKKANKLVLLLIIILSICIIDFTIISDKEADKKAQENEDIESVEQIENTIANTIENTVEENFSVSFETEEKTSQEPKKETSSETGNIEVITSWDFEEKVLNQEGLVVVDFYADWCVPCKKMEPIIESVANQKPNVKFVRIDTNNKNDAGIYKVNETYNVMYLPTIILFKDGEEVNRSIGLVDESTFIKLFEI